LRLGGFGLVAVLALAAAGCGGGGDEQARNGTQGGPGGGMGPGGGDRVIPVEVSQVSRGDIARSVSVSGVVEPIRVVGVNSQLSGMLVSIHAEEGTAVREGAVLARLDDRELTAQLANAQATYQIAQAAYERAQQLRDRNVITLPEFERDRAAYAAASAQLDQLRTRIGFATVRAPITGIVTEKQVEAGDVVAPQTRLFTVADVSTMVVRVGLSEMDVVLLSEGDEVALGLDAYPNLTLQGSIRRIFPTANPGTRLVPVEVALRGDGSRVARPGFLARTTFALGAREGLLVPGAAILSGAAGESVFVVEAGQAVRRTVQTGLTSAGQIEIVEGLAAGETVVTAGNTMLRDGMTVRIVAGEAGAAAVAPRPGPESAVRGTSRPVGQAGTPRGGAQGGGS
jgi:membrane fusion protein, multidrug efflux system